MMAAGILLLSSTTESCLAAGELSKVDFESQIAPLLRDHCIQCHWSANREGDISLETPTDLTDNDFIDTRHADNSFLLELVTASDQEPPSMPKEGRALSTNEVDLLRRWISQGAPWPEGYRIKTRSKADRSWWAYQPLLSKQNQTAEPTTRTEEPSPQTIDEFIRQKLSEKDLELSPPADRRTLIRRLTFDLHGLPPTPEAVEAFVNDPDPRSYERLVDRLLNSPRYGERYARHWLDLAHYADTHGFERDQRRDNAWRYRDYVIAALNADKPYDRFVAEQIAGDVLWPDDPSATVATGFLAAGPWDFVGQVETKSPILRRAARSLDLDDMATQVLTSTMAMTINCARCHDHKLDPISQREYYQLRAVFSGVRREDRVVSEQALEDYERSKDRLVARRNEIELAIGRLEGHGLDLADIVGGGNGLGSGFKRNGIDARTGKVQTRDFGQLGNVVTNKFATSEFEFIDGVFIPDGESETAQIPVSSTGLTVNGLPSTSGMAWDMIRNGPVASQHSPVLGGVDFTKDGHSLIGLHANAGITFNLTAIRDAILESKQSNESSDETEQGRTLRFTTKVGYFGAEGNHRADVWVFVDGNKVASFKQLQRVDGLQTVDVELAGTAQFLTLISTDGGNGFGHDQIGFGDASIKPAQPRRLNDADLRKRSELRTELNRIKRELASLGPPPRFYGVVAEKTIPEVRTLTRGNPESPSGDPLPPAALSALSMLDPELGSIDSGQDDRRAALARWITHPSNPLFRRVIANRLWQWHFGKGIVDTPSDFGFGGGRPSHPELLDWLAQELLRRDWSLKSMHRLIVTSETYKQVSYSSENFPHHARGAESDADNRLLWRQNPRRIEAEAVRDSVLFVSGKLNLQYGGPGFEDFQYQDAYAPIYTYVVADEPKLWRRSIYRYVVRTTPDRFLTTLDCPDPANLTPKRLTTTTPLQSLALFNNEFMLNQASYFAERIRKEAGPDVDRQVRRAFELAFARLPSDREAKFARDLVDEHGLFPLCRSLLNLNEFVYVD